MLIKTESEGDEHAAFFDQEDEARGLCLYLSTEAGFTVHLETRTTFTPYGTLEPAFTVRAFCALETWEEALTRI